MQIVKKLSKVVKITNKWTEALILNDIQGHDIRTYFHSITPGTWPWF